MIHWNLKIYLIIYLNPCYRTIINHARQQTYPKHYAPTNEFITLWFSLSLIETTHQNIGVQRRGIHIFVFPFTYLLFYFCFCFCFSEYHLIWENWFSTNKKFTAHLALPPKHYQPYTIDFLQQTMSPKVINSTYVHYKIKPHFVKCTTQATFGRRNIKQFFSRTSVQTSTNCNSTPNIAWEQE